MKKQPPSPELPEDDLHIPTPEERMERFGEMLRDARKGTPWEVLLPELLDAFERFLTERPAPPQEWQDRLGSEQHRYDYYQIVLPGDYTDPYKDDLENVQLLREKFPVGQSFMALENSLVTRNHFLFHNGHAAPVNIPRPLVMFESVTTSPNVSWDCALTVFPDGSWQAYNMDRDDEDSMGENIGEMLEAWMPIIRYLRVLVPEEGRDYGWFGT